MTGQPLNNFRLPPSYGSMHGLTRSIPPPDADLVQAYQGGDQRAAAELVLRHASAVGRFLYASGAASGDVEDLTQETFFRAFRKLDSWRGEASFRSWIVTIAGNLLKDEFRKEKGTRVISLDQHELPDHRDPHADLQMRESEDRMRQGIGALPRLQREVFLMRVQQGMGYEEIAAALETTPGAARVHYHHAVKRLKEIVV
jgi:RNA polymerase sigma-70 factor (ECF subfamily)